jgi:hypothetical protein
VLSDRSINFKATKVIFSVALKGHGNEADFLGFLQFSDSASQGVADFPTRRVRESLTLRLGF